jgi:DNA-directed RNA polymerase subunit beta
MSVASLPVTLPTDADGQILAELIPVRYRQDFEKVPPEQVDYVQLSPVK